MNGAQGRASHLLTLFILTIIVGAAILFWMLNSSSFFTEETRSGTAYVEPTRGNIRIPRLEDIRSSATAQTSSKEQETAEPEHIAEQKEAERRTAELKAAEQRVAELKAAEAQRIARKKAEQQRIADEQKAEEQRIARQKAEQQRITAEKKAEAQRIAELKAAEETQITKTTTSPAPRIRGNGETIITNKTIILDPEQAAPIILAQATNTAQPGTTEQNAPGIVVDDTEEPEIQTERAASTATGTPTPEQNVTPLANSTPTPSQSAALTESVTPTPAQSAALTESVTPTPAQSAALTESVTPTPSPGAPAAESGAPASTESVNLAAANTPTPSQSTGSTENNTPVPAVESPSAATTASPATPSAEPTETALQAAATPVAAALQTATTPQATPIAADNLLVTQAAETPGPTPTSIATAPPSLLTQQGWIYAGKYNNGEWSRVGIAIPNTNMPESGKTYKLTWGANVRSAPPGKKRADGTNLAENIGYLNVGEEIQVTTVKNSGRTGHIWLEIAY